MGVYNIKKWWTFRKIAAISGIIQGFAWMTMAAICIGLYHGKYPSGYSYYITYIMTENTRYIDFISYSFYGTILDSRNQEHRILKPFNFQIFAWLYGFLSLFWLGFAIWECVVLFKRKSSIYEAHLLMLSGCIILITCILDIVLMSIAFYEYNQINIFNYDIITPTTSTTTTTGTSPKTSLLGITSDDFAFDIDSIYRYQVGRKIILGVLATISARGFAIWVFNFVTGIVLLVISAKVFQAPPILKYDNKSIPRPKKIQGPSNKEETSSFGAVYAEDNDYYSTPPSQKKNYSMPSRYGPEQNRNYPLALNNKNRRNDNRFF